MLIWTESFYLIFLYIPPVYVNKIFHDNLTLLKSTEKWWPEWNWTHTFVIAIHCFTCWAVESTGIGGKFLSNISARVGDIVWETWELGYVKVDERSSSSILRKWFLSPSPSIELEDRSSTCTRYSCDYLMLVRERMCSVLIPFQNHPQRHTWTEIFRDNIENISCTCQIKTCL